MYIYCKRLDFPTNLMQVASNWLLGWRIVEQEQHGERRTEYGKLVIEQASRVLTEEFGKGFNKTTLRAYRQFYQTFLYFQIQRTMPVEFENKGNNSVVEVEPVPVQLSWMHYECLMRVKDAQAREWYTREATQEQWDYRTLKRNIDSQYCYRLLQTPNTKKQIKYIC